MVYLRHSFLVIMHRIAMFRHLFIVPLLVVFLFSPTVLHTRMSGGTYEIYADTFSFAEGGLGTGGSLELFGSSEAVGVGRTQQVPATGTVTFDPGVGLWNYNEQIIIEDGLTQVIFEIANFGGISNATCKTGTMPNCSVVYVDLGGGFGDNVNAGIRLAAAINASGVHSLGMKASDDGAGVVTLTNTAVPGSLGNIPMREQNDSVDGFVLSGMSNGTDGSLFLNGGFQAMETGSISMTVTPHTIDFSDLDRAAVKSDSLVLNVNTESSTGYTITAAEDGNLRSGANDIDDVADGTVSAGAEEYGIRTTSGVHGRLPTDAAISGTLTVVSATQSVVNDQTTLQFNVAIDNDTALGDYSHIVTLSATVNP
jgi:hypothetical protein